MCKLMQGPVHAAGLIVKEEGLRGLWSGAAPTVMRNGTNQMCLFWAKNHMDRLLWGKEASSWSLCSNFPSLFWLSHAHVLEKTLDWPLWGEEEAPPHCLSNWIF